MKSSIFKRSVLCSESIILCLLFVFSFSLHAQRGNSNGNNRNNFKQWSWEEVNNNANWSPRAGLQVLNHQDQFFLFGGRTPLGPNITPVPGASIIHGDVWSSSDKGVTWERILESNPTPPGFPPNPNLTSHWANRSYFQALNKGDEMFIIGGQDFNIITVPNPDFPDNCPEAPFPGAPNPPCEPTMQVPFSQFFNDVWKSSDGINWSRIIDNQIISPEEPNPTHWVGRAGLSAVVFNDYIYVMGGSVNDDTAIVSGAPARQYFNDVWRSSDGSSWEKVNNAPWAPRAGGIAVVKDNYMYMIGGEEGFTCPFDPNYPPTEQPPCLDPPYFNDVWRTQNGVDWELVTDDAPWVARPGHQVVVAQNRLVLFGGFGLGPDNGINPANPMDIWISNNGNNWKKVSDSPWNANDSSEIKYDFDAVVVNGEGNNSDMIFSFGGDRETFNFFDPFNYLNVDNDVWKFSYEGRNNRGQLRLNQKLPSTDSNTTTLYYEIPSKGDVLINIYNLYGQLVKSFELPNQMTGKHKIDWNEINSHGKKIKAGVYISKLIFEGNTVTKKLIIN